MELTRIFHPTDFSNSATRALQLATDLAATHDATLYLFHAETLHGEGLDQSTEALDAAAAMARDRFGRARPGHPPKIEVVTGRAILPFEAIMHAAEEYQPELIVIGTHGHTRFSTLLMGSTAEKVLRHAPCDVLTVKSGAPIPENAAFRTLLVPVDFSESATRALDGAKALQTDDGATIHLVHVVQPIPPMYLAGQIASYFELDPGLRDRIEQHLGTWAGVVPNSRTHITEGNPALEVARLSDALDADLIVMSTKGLTGVEHLLVGSVTERVCRFSVVPVLVMR